METYDQKSRRLRIEEEEAVNRYWDYEKEFELVDGYVQEMDMNLHTFSDLVKCGVEDLERRVVYRKDPQDKEAVKKLLELWTLAMKAEVAHRIHYRSDRSNPTYGMDSQTVSF